MRLDALPATSDELMADLLARGSYDDTHPLDPGACPAVLAAPLPRGVRRAAGGVAQAHGGLVGNAGRARRHLAQSGPAGRQEDRLEAAEQRARS